MKDSKVELLTDSELERVTGGVQTEDLPGDSTMCGDPVTLADGICQRRSQGAWDNNVHCVGPFCKYYGSTYWL